MVVAVMEESPARMQWQHTLVVMAVETMMVMVAMMMVPTEPAVMARMPHV